MADDYLSHMGSNVYAALLALVVGGAILWHIGAENTKRYAAARPAASKMFVEYDINRNNGLDLGEFKALYYKRFPNRRPKDPSRFDPAVFTYRRYNWDGGQELSLDEFTRFYAEELVR
ncbi:hypothetical protein KY337_06165 [Candidatus Woesearchaeota archaeon]|nr:hypothetical protein [Candidatus Woesearchaeota archaeon]